MWGRGGALAVLGPDGRCRRPDRVPSKSPRIKAVGRQKYTPHRWAFSFWSGGLPTIASRRLGAGDSRFLRAMCVKPGHHNVGDQATPSYSTRGMGPADLSAGLTAAQSVPPCRWIGLSLGWLPRPQAPTRRAPQPSHVSHIAPGCFWLHYWYRGFHNGAGRRACGADACNLPD